MCGRNESLNQPAAPRPSSSFPLSCSLALSFGCQLINMSVRPSVRGRNSSSVKESGRLIWERRNGACKHRRTSRMRTVGLMSGDGGNFLSPEWESLAFSCSRRRIHFSCKYVGTIHRHRIGRSGEFCIYHLNAFSLRRRE